MLRITVEFRGLHAASSTATGPVVSVIKGSLISHAQSLTAPSAPQVRNIYGMSHLYSAECIKGAIVDLILVAILLCCRKVKILMRKQGRNGQERHLHAAKSNLRNICVQYHLLTKLSRMSHLQDISQQFLLQEISALVFPRFHIGEGNLYPSTEIIKCYAL